MATTMDPSSNGDFLNWRNLYEEKKKENDILEKIYTSLLNDFTKNQVRLEDLNKENLELKQRNNEKENKIQQLEADFRGKLTTIESNKERIEHIEQEIENLEQENKERLQDIEILQQKNKELQQENEKLQQEIQNLRQDNKNIRQEIAIVQQEIQKLEEKNKNLQEEVEEFESSAIEKADNNNNTEKHHPPRIADEFLRLVKKHIEPLVGDSEEMGQSLFSHRLDILKERVIDHARQQNQRLLQAITVEFEKLPSKLFEPWLSDFLTNEKCPKLSLTNYESAFTEITDSVCDKNIKNNALHAIKLLKDLYAKVGESFGGNDPIAGGDSMGNTPRKRQKLSE